jgi:PPP family 3-phenylpropionic acid transporter
MRSRVSIHLKRNLNVMYFVVFGSLACFSPFFPVYLQQRNLSYTEIGIALAVNSIIGVVFQPIWGFITDKYFNKRFTLIMTITVSALLVFNFNFSKGFYTIIIITILFTIFQSPIIAVNDAYCYEIIDVHKEIQYGRVRLMGSIGFALTSLVLGSIIKKSGVGYSYFAYMLMAAVAVFVLKNIQYKGKSIENKINSKDVYNFIKSKSFIIFCLSALIASIAWNGSNNYISVLIQKTGGDTSKVGVVWFIIALSELPAFFFGNKIFKKYGVVNVYLFSLILYGIRFFSVSFCTNYIFVLAIQVLQGVTFPLYLMATIQYVSDIVPSEARASALTTFNAITMGAGGFLGNIGGGIALEYIDIFSFYRSLSLLCVFALAIGFLVKKDHSQNSLILNRY